MIVRVSENMDDFHVAILLIDLFAYIENDVYEVAVWHFATFPKNFQSAIKTP